MYIRNFNSNFLKNKSLSVQLMHPVRGNMFLVCVTVGLVLLASKYHKNVFQSVRHLCQCINSKSCKQSDNKKKDLKITLDKIILADTPEKCDYAIQRIHW